MVCSLCVIVSMVVFCVILFNFFCSVVLEVVFKVEVFLLSSNNFGLWINVFVMVSFCFCLLDKWLVEVLYWVLYFFGMVMIMLWMLVSLYVFLIFFWVGMWLGLELREMLNWMVLLNKVGFCGIMVMEFLMEVMEEVMFMLLSRIEFDEGE